jgi:hypothetical protein
MHIVRITRNGKNFAVIPVEGSQNLMYGLGHHAVRLLVEG